MRRFLLGFFLGVIVLPVGALLAVNLGTLSTRANEAPPAWEKALALEGVHGLVVGRALLYPPDGDVAAAVDTAAALVKPRVRE